MSKKNSNVKLKNFFENSDNFSKIFLKFKTKIFKLKKKSLVVAISGGPDSLALASLCKAVSYKKDLKFHYILVNHNLRKNSKRESLQVKKLLKKFNINLKIFNNKKKIKNNIQAEARNIRYETLKTYCIKNKIKIILTAHNLEDQVETFFIRLSRGSGLTGLSSMKSLTSISHSVKLYRPLLDTNKIILVKISKKVFGVYFNDPSNQNKKFLRTKIRNLKKHLIESGIEYDQIIKSINNLNSSKLILDKYYKKIFKETVSKTRNEVFIHFKRFKDFEDEIKIKLINKAIKILRGNYYDARSKKVLNLIKNVQNKRFIKSTLAGCLFYLKKEHLCLKLEKRD